MDVLSASGRMSSEGTEYWLGGDEVVLAYGQPSPCEATCTEVALCVVARVCWPIIPSNHDWMAGVFLVRLC